MRAISSGETSTPRMRRTSSVASRICGCASVRATTSSSALNESSFQIAIWALVNGDQPVNGKYDFSQGPLIMSGPTNAINQAQDWLNNLAGPSSFTAQFLMVQNQFGSNPVAVGTYPESQDVVYFVSSPVPEPKTYAMLLAGLGFIGFMARRRKGLGNTSAINFA